MTRLKTPLAGSKTAAMAGRGYDAGKKVKGRKRQVMVDTDGRALVIEPQPANVQDRGEPARPLRRGQERRPSESSGAARIYPEQEGRLRM